MALLGNYSTALKAPIRRFGGQGSETGMRPAFGGNGALRGRQFQDGSTTADRFQSLPSASYPQVAYMLPQKGQWLSSHYDANIAFTATATGVKGMPGTGSSSFAITIADATGQLIMSGSGSTSFVVSGDTSALTASLAGTGSTSLAVTVADALLGAEASVIGSATMTFSGSLSPYAIGTLVADIQPYTTLSPENLANAVWETVASAHMTSNTMGAKLNAAGGASDPWGVVIEGSMTAGEVLKVLASALAGKVSGANTGTITFRNLSDNGNVIVATVDGNGNRTSVTLTP